MECEKFNSDSEEAVSSTDDDSESVEERKVPLQLMVEMVNSLVRKEYVVTSIIILTIFLTFFLVR